MSQLEKLIAELQKRGSKARIARATGLSVRTLSKIQRGDTTPVQRTLRAIATALGYDPDHFLDNNMEGVGRRRRLVIELELDADADFTEEELLRIRGLLEAHGKDIVETVKKLKKG